MSVDVGSGEQQTKSLKKRERFFGFADQFTVYISGLMWFNYSGSEMKEDTFSKQMNSLCVIRMSFDSRTRFVSVVSGFLFDHHMGRRKPLRLCPGHVGHSVVQRVQVLLFEVLLRRIRQAGVRVLPMVTAASAPAGVGRMHALQGLALGREWWAHLCRAGREPGTGRKN